jgi:hypothetical protein
VRQVSETFTFYVEQYLDALLPAPSAPIVQGNRAAPSQARQVAASAAAHKDYPSRRGGPACRANE